MSLSAIGTRVQLGAPAHAGLATDDRRTDDPRVRAQTSAGGDDRSSFSIGLGAIGAVGLVGGIAMRFAGLGKVGTGIAALGGAILGASLLTALNSGPKGPPIPGDEGRPGGDVSTYPSTLEKFRTDADTTNPAPAGYDPRSGSRDAREGVVQISHGGGTGSGWVVDPGTIVTNYHVAQGHRELTVTDHAGREHAGVVRKLDRTHDLAVIDAPTLQDAPLAMDDVVDHAETGETTGYPDGDFSNDRAVAVGNVRVDDDGRERDAIFFSGTSAEGVSGGAVINGAGEVLGTAFAVGELPATDASDAEPFVLAIPNDQVRAFVDAPTPAVTTTG